MKQYYYEQLQMSILKYELAQVGYESRMKELATQLITEDEINHGPIIEKINALREALDDFVAETQRCSAMYNAEREKEVAKDA